MTKSSLPPFSAMYYIYKTPERGDIKKLEQYASSADASEAADASLILGYYYLRDGKIRDADPLITIYNAHPYISPDLGKLGELWAMELAIAQENYAAAFIWLQQVEATKDDENTLKALHTYCNLMGLTPAESGAISCAVERLSEYMDLGDTYLQGLLNILVVSRADVSGAIFYYMTNHNMTHKVNMSETFIEGNWDFILDINNANLAGRGFNISFAPDVASVLSDVEYYAGLSNCGRVLLGTGMGLGVAGEALSRSLKNSGSTVSTVHITDAKAASSGARSVLENWQENRFCVVGAGDEAEINYFIPVARQYRVDSSKQSIFIVQPVDTGAHYKKGYGIYYREAIVFPVIDLTFSSQVKDFSIKYKAFTGQDINYEELIAYDMMHYIYRQTEDGKTSQEPFLTHIAGVKGGKVQRPVRAFYILSDDQAEELVLSSGE